MKKIIVFTSLVTALCLSSCSPTKVSYSKNFVPPQKIGFITTVIGPLEQPVIPLIDAALLNAKINKIAPQIMQMEQRYVNNIERMIAVNLGKPLRCRVVDAKELRLLPTFQKLQNDIRLTPPTDFYNRDFSKFICSDYTLCPFSSDKDDLYKYFTKNEDYQTTFSVVCKSLNLDMLAVSYSKLNMVQAGVFGIYGKLRLETYLLLFNQNGVLVAQGRSYTNTTEAEAKDIGDYAEQMGFAEGALKNLLSEFYNKFPKQK